MPKKLLIVDDTVEICDGLAEIFRDDGYDVSQAFGSAQGADLIKKNRYDISILDYKMKGLNGIDLLRLIKKDNPVCAVFMISARASTDKLIMKENIAGLVAGFFTKPFDIEALVQKVREVQ